MKPLSPLRAAIIGAGFAHNEHLLDLNGCLEDPAPRYPASRMFKWPITVDPYEDRLTVCHLAMATEPFAVHVLATLRHPIEVEPNPRGCQGSWQHGGDLANDKHFRDLLATRDLVDDRVIMRGVTHGVMGNSLSTANARIILAAIEVEEPADRSASALSSRGGFIRPAFIDDGAVSGKGKACKGKWAVNLWSNKHPRAEPWAAIHGVEDGWFRKDKYGYHYMSIAGMVRHTGGPPAP